MKPLNPIMAVLVIASVGALPLRTLADDGSKPVMTAEDTNSVNALTKVLTENPAARKDAGKRFEEFLTTEVGGASFLATGVDKKAVGAVAQAWGETKGPVGNVALLYFVMGPGTVAPPWAQKDPILSKTFMPGQKWEGILRAKLADKVKGPDWTGKNQITKTKEKSQTTAFIDYAVAKAPTVFDERSKEKKDESINANNTTAPVVPNTQKNPSTRLDGATQQYSLTDLYTDGAVVVDVAGPKDKGSRRISMKIYSTRTPPPENKIYNEIGIFDITDSNDIYGQRFPLDGATQTFALDDRTSGHKKYELTFADADKDGNRKITFARPGSDKGGTKLETTVSDLLMKRADQAAGMKNIVTIDGQDFYALPQGGAKSAIALFPKALIDKRADVKEKRDLEPGLYAEIGTRGPDGRNQNIADAGKGGPHLGKLGDKSYHLVFNKAIGAWEVKEGEGDLPKPPATPSTSTTTATNDGNGNTNTNTNTNTTTNSDGEKSIADLETLALKSSDCKKNPDDTKDLAPDLKGKYGIIACNSATEGWYQLILVPKTASTPNQQLQYGSVPGYKLQRARFYDHYLILQFDKQVQYLDLLKQDKDANGKESGFALAGFIADKNASKFTDVQAFVDALKNYMGIAAGSADAGAFTAVPANLKTALGNKPYGLTGAFAKGALVVHVSSGGDSFMIWPKVTKPGAQTDPTPNPYTSLSGPANAMDGSVSSVNAAFPDVIDLPESRQAKAKMTQTDIALYESVDLTDKKEPKKYYLMFSYNALDPKDPAKPEGEKEKKVFRQKWFEVFNESNPYPDGLQLQGLTAASDAVVSDRVASGYRFISGTTKDKGVLAVFQQKQVAGASQKNSAANCVGPVAWWGMDRDAAMKVCKADKF